MNDRTFDITGTHSGYELYDSDKSDGYPVMTFKTYQEAYAFKVRLESEMDAATYTHVTKPEKPRSWK